VKLQIYLTAAMANALLLSAQQERRYPRQQAEWLLERVLGVSTPQAQTIQAVVYEGPTVEGGAGGGRRMSRQAASPEA
jgi:hypothetical protein